MTKIDIYSGFLGAGKTTLIKKMIREAYGTEKLVLIENEFGEIGIDGGFMQEAGIQVNEMNSGCICCSLVGDFGKALREVISQYQPDRILIEPSGVGKLSDIIAAVQNVDSDDIELGCFVTVADATKCKLYLKNFGEFYNNQIETASTIVLSRTDKLSEEKLAAAVSLLREHNQSAMIITTPWSELTGVQIMEAMECQHSLTEELSEMIEHEHHHEHHHDHDECCHEHHHHDHDECDHEHHHDHDECDHDHHHDHDECDHDHHHDHDECDHDHHHDHDECDHEYHHDHDECDHEHHHDEYCHDHHHHHHGHDADEVFQSWGVETPKKFTREELTHILSELENAEAYGIVLRAKGIVPSADGTWLHFDHVPEETDIRTGCAAVTGRLCVIGSKLNEQAVAALFGV